MKTEQVDGEVPRQKCRPLLNPDFAMIEAFALSAFALSALACQVVGPAEKRAPDAPIDVVIDAHFGRIEDELTRDARHE